MEMFMQDNYLITNEKAMAFTIIQTVVVMKDGGKMDIKKDMEYSILMKFQDLKAHGKMERNMAKE